MASNRWIRVLLLQHRWVLQQRWRDVFSGLMHSSRHWIVLPIYASPQPHVYLYMTLLLEVIGRTSFVRPLKAGLDVKTTNLSLRKSDLDCLAQCSPVVITDMSKPGQTQADVFRWAGRFILWSWRGMIWWSLGLLLVFTNSLIHGTFNNRSWISVFLRKCSSISPHHSWQSTCYRLSTRDVNDLINPIFWLVGTKESHRV